MGNPIRPRRSLLWMLPCAIGAAAACPVGAACFPSTDFGQLVPNCGGAYCYVISPSQNTTESLLGSFWSFSTGDPAVGSGNDSGVWSDDAWLIPSGSEWWLAGDWGQDPGIDGCILGRVATGKPAEIMVVLLDDSDGYGSAFAAASARRVAGSFPEFDFTFAAGGGVPGDIRLVGIPVVYINYYDGGAVWQLTGATWAQVSPGIYGDGSLSAEEVAKGSRVYARETAWTSLKRTAGWSAISGIIPFGETVTVNMPCPDSGKVYFAQTIVFDSGFETDYVSMPHQVTCDRCPPATQDQDGDGWFNLLGDPECCPMFEYGLCDCDDLDPNVHPFAEEVCNGVDDDCNFAVDDLSGLQLGKDSATTTLDWTPLAGSPHYDVVLGDLGPLIATGGDFSQATNSCLASDLVEPHAEDPSVPDPGSGVWYLVRASGCGGGESYDESHWSSLKRSRDSGIAASGADCP